MPALAPFRLVPDYRHRVWGGHRLRPGPEPIGEAWLVFDHNTVAGGQHAGLTLAKMAAQAGEALLGSHGMLAAGGNFPLLLKLLDTSDWLSVQVHPNDEQAHRLEGPTARGKTEAWHILDAAADAQLIVGPRPGIGQDALESAIRNGTLLDCIMHERVREGDTVLVPAGTVHALGPGLLLYEVQQSSDITYRVFDWNRPQTPARTLHVEQSASVASAASTARVQPLPPIAPAGGAVPLTSCRYFTLAMVAAGDEPVRLDTRGETFHALTVIGGEAMLTGEGWTAALSRLDTVLVPAACGSYTIRGRGGLRLLKAAVP